MATCWNGGFNGSKLNSIKNDEVDIEVKDECEVVDDWWFENEQEEKCISYHQIKNWITNRRIWGEK